MLLSMTGFGEARTQMPTFGVGVEVRAVNNRHLKVSVRGSDPYPLLESELEKVVRRHVKRGTLHIQIRVERQARPSDLKLNAAAIATYIEQIRSACESTGAPHFVANLLPGVLALPGVAPEPGLSSGPPEEEWPAVESTLEVALDKLHDTRACEGLAMATELLSLQAAIRTQLEHVTSHLPTVMTDYRQRIRERITQAVAEAGVTVTADHMIREIALFADRSDVAEEVMRLSAHLDSFTEIIRKESDGPGRRLEFVVQEMGRETNTLGSKAGDVTISRYVIEMKSALEKIRELIQNVE